MQDAASERWLTQAAAGLLGVRSQDCLVEVAAVDLVALGGTLILTVALLAAVVAVPGIPPAARLASWR